jgi:hypothetical protein
MIDQNAVDISIRDGRGDRRKNDRRQADRRLPLPVWRRPTAYMAYGVVGTVLLILLIGRVDERNEPDADATVSQPSTPEFGAPGAELPAGAVRTAYTLAQYERLLAEGEQAVGHVVQTELYCGSIAPVMARLTDNTTPTLSALADAEGRVPGAECRWSQEARSADFLLIVPPNLAEQFARAPEVELNFVRRRQIPARLVWLGRSEELALRNSGVLQAMTQHR